MLMHAVDSYLAIRRAAGFALIPIEGYLRHFARFATACGDTHVVATTAIAWATVAPSEAQRHYRLQTVVRFARFMAAEDPRHEIPPVHVFRAAARVRPRTSSRTTRSSNSCCRLATLVPQGPYGPKPTVRCLACSRSRGCVWPKPSPSST